MEEEKERESEREEKERESEREEEKECDETEDSARATEGAVLSSQDDSDLPIMHWEALSMRIAELEKQEEERKERLKSTSEVERGNVSVGWMEERDGGSWWEDVEADRSRRITALTSRFHNQKNLQLCFINDSGSEDEDGERAGGESSREAAARGRGQADQAPPPAADQAPPPAAAERAKQTRGLKLEVRAALSALRDKLWSEQKQKEVERRPLALSDLQALSLKELSSHRASLTQAIHDLSSELVNRLLTRDQLRTEQDAMLLDVEDMTSV